MADDTSCLSHFKSTVSDTIKLHTNCYWLAVNNKHNVKEERIHQPIGLHSLLITSQQDVPGSRFVAIPSEDESIRAFCLREYLYIQ